MTTGTLYLIPAPLADGNNDAILPAEVIALAARLDTFVVEHPKTARQILKRYGTTHALQDVRMTELNEHTPDSAVKALLEPLLSGKDVGILSEAGCPGIADPGANLVRLAHDQGIRVVPLVGPSSILLALMAAGASGQRFRFHGYLPVDASARHACLRTLEKDSRQLDEAQVFIETPYRNVGLIDAIRTACHKETRLTVACDLTAASETIVSKPIKSWPSDNSQFNKRPALFVMYAGK